MNTTLVLGLWGCLLMGVGLFKVFRAVYLLGAVYGYTQAQRDINDKDATDGNASED